MAPDGASRVSLSIPQELKAMAVRRSNMASENTTHDDIVLPLHAEEIAVGKERINTGTVRVSTVTRKREEMVEELLAREDVEVERRPVGKPVDHAPAVRRAGDTVIIPVVEEVLVVTRRLVVKEEIWIRLVHRREKHSQQVTVRSQEAVIERLTAATRGPPPVPHPQTEPINHPRPAKQAGEK
jgi:uncharacterized protein (TIGR02271 family)